MKTKFIIFLRTIYLQFLWEKLFNISKALMNYWGGADIYISGERKILKNIEKNNINKRKLIFFDVGGYTGGYSKMIAENVNNSIIYTFEPSEKAYKELINNTKDIKNISVNKMALSHSVGNATLNHSGQMSPLAFISDNETHEDNLNHESVEVSTIDNYCRQNGIESIDLLKIDVEGNEIYVLKGAQYMISSKKILIIQFEFGERNVVTRVFFKDFWDYLSELYDFYRICPDGIRLIKEYNYGLEVFHTANYLLKLKKEVL